ncbi:MULTISPECIES: hypothetical protein [unclassified Anabaena]|uniref:hypothetical protein n=1 Tax=unclassified Anabaena TaxID=2619674 RepID=UPI000AD02461|nr:MULTISPECIES: hypothetical protein [unclassified Anabaena]
MKDSVVNWWRSPLLNSSGKLSDSEALLQAVRFTRSNSHFEKKIAKQQFSF